MNNTSLMRKIQELSFAKVEAELYLDTHPNCRNALEYYEALLEELDTAMTKYQNEYRALYQQAAATDRWSWVDDKWPWHHDYDDSREGK